LSTICKRRNIFDCICFIVLPLYLHIQNQFGSLCHSGVCLIKSIERRNRTEGKPQWKPATEGRRISDFPLAIFHSTWGELESIVYFCGLWQMLKSSLNRKLINKTALTVADKVIYPQTPVLKGVCGYKVFNRTEVN